MMQVTLALSCRCVSKKSVRLNEISLRQFRNIKELKLTPANSLNFFVGENAQGKTSILEGIYFLSTLKSFRQGKLQDLAQAGKGSFQIEGILGKTSLKVRMQDGQKKCLVDEKPVTFAEFISILRVVVFSPDSLAAVKYGSELRRDLIDQAVFQISTKAALAQSDYAHALRQRNSCLRQMKSGLTQPRQGREILESLEPGFLRLAAEVTFYRLEFLDAIGESMAEILSQIMGMTISLKFLYESGEQQWFEREYSAIHRRLQEEMSSHDRTVAEEAVGLTLTGPHRHDLNFIFNETNSRIFCSQGQQRALILSFKMAEIVYHGKAFDTYPLLLLDDVLSEFDEKKRRFLVDFLRSHQAQTFLTTTDQTQTLDGCQVFYLKAGALLG